jgi:hypothetical protein
MKSQFRRRRLPHLDVPGATYFVTACLAGSSPRERIMHSVKRHSANECHRLMLQQGTFWQDESYDHCVRDDAELERINAYVERNPVKPGLATSPELWPFSSAWLLNQPELQNRSPLAVGQVSNLPGLLERMLAAALEKKPK